MTAKGKNRPAAKKSSKHLVALKEASSAVKSGFLEGAQARKDGRPCDSPYLGADGEPIEMLRGFHQGWLMGWSAMSAANREKA